jgi:ABC-type sulfate transport system permease subunit
VLLRVAGFSSPPAVPNVTLPVLVWHLVYGVVLGGIYPFVEDL